MAVMLKKNHGFSLAPGAAFQELQGFALEINCVCVCVHMCACIYGII